MNWQVKKKQIRCDLNYLKLNLPLVCHLMSLLLFSFYSLRFILRNYIAQNAITAAEKGDFSEVLHGYQYQNNFQDSSGDI